jgi:hypothetical protein
VVNHSQLESATVSAPPTVRLTRPSAPQPVACLRTRVHSADARNGICIYLILLGRVHTGGGGDQPEVALRVHLTQAQPPTLQVRAHNSYTYNASAGTSTTVGKLKTDSNLQQCQIHGLRPKRSARSKTEHCNCEFHHTCINTSHISTTDTNIFLTSIRRLCIVFTRR